MLARAMVGLVMRAAAGCASAGAAATSPTPAGCQARRTNPACPASAAPGTPRALVSPQGGAHEPGRTADVTPGSANRGSPTPGRATLCPGRAE